MIQRLPLGPQTITLTDVNRISTPIWQSRTTIDVLTWRRRQGQGPPIKQRRGRVDYLFYPLWTWQAAGQA
jgi:hypothetical protein